MELVESIEVTGEGVQHADEGESTQHRVSDLSLEVCRRKFLLAKAARLEAEARLLDDVGAYYKGLAARAEAEADLKIIEKDREERLASDPRIAKLLRAERAWQVLKTIRRNQEDARRAKQRKTEPKGSNNTRGGRPAGSSPGGKGRPMAQESRTTPQHPQPTSGQQPR